MIPQPVVDRAANNSLILYLKGQGIGCSEQSMVNRVMKACQYTVDPRVVGISALATIPCISSQYPVWIWLEIDIATSPVETRYGSLLCALG